MRVTIASLISPSRPGLMREVASRVRADEALYLWLRDSAGPVVFELPPVPTPEWASAGNGKAHSEPAVLEEAESLEAMRLLLSFAGPETVRRFERAFAQAARLGRSRLPASLDLFIFRLEGAVTRYLQAERHGVLGLEEVADLLQAWSALVVLVEGKEALYRIYEGRVKSGKVELVQEAQRVVVRYSLRLAVRRLVRFIRLAKGILRRCRRERLALQDAYRVIPLPVVTPVSAPKSEPTAKPALTTGQAKPASERAHKRGEKAAAVASARAEAEKRERERKIKRAAKEAARRRAAVRRGVKEALRRKKLAALRSRAAAAMLPQIHAALVESLRWGVVPDREVAGTMLQSLRGREADAGAVVRVIEAVGAHDVVARLAFAYDDAGGFEAVVGSASDGGRDAERRLLAELAACGVEVVTSQKADRQAGVDAIVTVGGVRVALQLTTMSWWAATTPTEAGAAKRLANGRVEVGSAVSKIQKDLEKFRKHYADLPYVFVGVNVGMPFTPEQYVDDVLRLLERQASSGGVRVAFIAAPGLVAYEGVQQ